MCLNNALLKSEESIQRQISEEITFTVQELCFTTVKYSHTFLLHIHVYYTLTGTDISAWENTCTHYHDHTAGILQCVRKPTKEYPFLWQLTHLENGNLPAVAYIDLITEVIYLNPRKCQTKKKTRLLWMRRENEIYFNKDKNHEDYICSPQSQDTAFKTIPFSITRIGQFYFKQVSYLQKSWFHPFCLKICELLLHSGMGSME